MSKGKYTLAGAYSVPLIRYGTIEILEMF